MSADPLRAAWPRGCRLLSVDEVNRPSAVEGRMLGISDYQRFDRIHWGEFFKHEPHPPDVLVVRIPKDPKLEANWETHLLHRDTDARPKYLVILERAGDLLPKNSDAY